MGSVVSKAVSPPVFRNPDAAPQRADGIGSVEWAGMRSIDTGLIGCREVYSAEHRESLQSTKTRTSSYLVRWRSIGVVIWQCVCCSCIAFGFVKRGCEINIAAFFCFTPQALGQLHSARY